MSVYIGVHPGGHDQESVARQVKKMYIGVGGVARRVKKMYASVNGLAKLVVG